MIDDPDTETLLSRSAAGDREGWGTLLIRAERKARLEEALNAMDPTDREVLGFRHFEHLSNSEAARELGLRESAASKRYLRALSRLHVILRGPGGFRGETG
jgi:RNA polymerase sigma-70 factor (ECF subfamily)